MSVGVVNKSTGDRIQTAGDPLDKVGNLANLTTTAKDNAVNAINEVNATKANQTQLATVEASTTASKAYSANDYLVLGGVLYKVTANIAQGGTIVTEGAGKNVDLVTVGGELNAINSNLTSLSSKVNRGTVSVTPDGVKSFSQLFDALYALMDTSKINGLSVLQVGNAYYHCTYISTYLEFTSINHGNAANNSFTTRLAISQSGSVYTICYFSGNFEDNSAIVPTANEFEIVLHY